jgi:hypothetical protein
MNQNKKVQNEDSKSIKVNTIVPLSTKGEGDCPFHAALGTWNSLTQQFETSDVQEKRQRVANAISNCESDSALFPLIKAAIMELVYSGRNIPGGIYQNLKEAYKIYEEKDNNLIKSKWAIFEKELNKYSSILDHINQFVEEYIN